MISLSDFLLRAQRARSILDKHLLVRMVLTYGATTHTYTKTRIKQISHKESVYSQKVNAILDDSDKTLHGLDLEGYKAVMSYGLITRAGPEYIDRAPMWVVGQDRDSYRDRLECGFELEGIFDRWAKQKAESVFSLPSTNTDTVKTHIAALAANTLTDGTNTPFTNYPAYTVTIDNEDDLYDTFIPADGLRIGLNQTRLSVLKELLKYTDCVAKIGNDEAIHILVPVKTGTTYDNEYSLVYGRDQHNFFNKRFRRRVVSPNYITFKNHPSHDDSFTGFAKDASADLDESSGGNGSMLERETNYVRAISNAQCTNLANARLSKYQMQAEKGAGVLPFVHFGQEIYDYVNFVDARAGDNRPGNVGNLTMQYKQIPGPGQFNMSLGFGRVPLGVAALQGLSPETGITAQNLLPLIDQAYSYIEQLLDIVSGKADIDDVNETLLALYEDAYFRKATVTQELNIPSEAA